MVESLGNQKLEEEEEPASLSGTNLVGAEEGKDEEDEEEKDEEDEVE